MPNPTPAVIALPSDQEARELLARFKNNNDEMALESLKEKHRGLVFDIAKTYSADPDLIGELISEGDVGLMRACQKFSLGRKIEFVLYAKIWIKSNIETYIRKSAYSFNISSAERDKMLKGFKMHQAMTNRAIPEADIIIRIARKLDLTPKLARKLVALSNAIIHLSSLKSAT